jgi:hypothetical protein
MDMTYVFFYVFFPGRTILFSSAAEKRFRSISTAVDDT